MSLTCPRCGLTILPRADWLVVEHCPRCLARRHSAVRMLAFAAADGLFDDRPRPPDARQIEERP